MLISTEPFEGCSVGDQNTSRRISTRLYKIEQRSCLRILKVTGCTARCRDIDREPGLGRAISFISPSSSSSPWKTAMQFKLSEIDVSLSPLQKSHPVSRFAAACSS